MRESAIYNEGLFGFGVTDGATPNAYNWGTAEIINKLGAGRLSSGDKGIVTFRWTKCYEIISRANFLLANLDLVNLPEEKKKMFFAFAENEIPILMQKEIEPSLEDIFLKLTDNTSEKEENTNESDI